MTAIGGRTRTGWRAILLGIAIALGLSAGLAASASASANGWKNTGVVQASGGPYLTDQFGRALQLHGVNLVGKCGGGSIDVPVAGTPCVGPAQGPGLAFVLSPLASDPGRRFTAADAATLAELGFNTVRLGIIWEGLEPGPPGVGPNDPAYCAPHRSGTPFPSLGAANPYDPAAVQAYLARTDTIVGLLEQAGLRVIIDMHSDVYGSAFSYAKGVTPWNGEGAPPWATCYGRARFVAPIGWGSGYTSRAVQLAVHHFFANDVRADLQGQYARVWQAVARHYRHDPEVLGYEIYNEPDDQLVRHFDPELQCDYGGPAHEPRSCAVDHPQALRDGLIGAIQAADPGHVVFFEPSGATIFGGPERIGIGEPLGFTHVALSFHVYGPAPQQLSETESERAHTETGQPGGPPWIMDEFGANDATPSFGTVSRADADNLSWVYWSALQLNDPTGADPDEGLLGQISRQPYPAVARSLAVPYPWATAGQPAFQHFDRRTRTFSYRYVPDRRIKAPTEISIPAYTFPQGYLVLVSGANVVSAPNAPVLGLSAQRGAAEVEVTVRPGVQSR